MDQAGSWWETGFNAFVSIVCLCDLSICGALEKHFLTYLLIVLKDDAAGGDDDCDDGNDTDDDDKM